MNPFRSFVVGHVYSDQTIPLEQSFYRINEHRYTQLEKRVIECRPRTNSIPLVSDGLIDRISLDTFPVGQYTLSINGQNCSTARYNTTRQCYEFDFSQHRSNTLEGMIAVSHNGAQLPELPNLNKYLNCQRIDRLLIFHPNTLPDQTYNLSLHGYFPTGQSLLPEITGPYVEKMITKQVHPYHTYELMINHPTDCLDLLITRTQRDCTIILELDGYEAIRYHSDEIRDELCDGIRIKFNNPDLCYMGAENKMLPETINKQTLNCSRISSILVRTINCQLIKCEQVIFMAYHYPSRMPIFAS